MTKGKWALVVLVAVGLALALPRSVTAQTMSSDPSTTAVIADAGAAPEKHHAVPFSEAWLAQFGAACAGTAGVALAATYMAGPTEAMMLFGGGLLTASSSARLALALLGQIGAPSCVMGAAIAPTALWAYGASDQIWKKVVESVDAAGQGVQSTFSSWSGRSQDVAALAQ